MAATDASQTIALSDALDMQDEVFEMDPVVQRAAFGATTQHITRVTDWVAGSSHRKILKERYSGARVTSSLEADAHSAGQIDVADIEIAETNLRRIGVPLLRSLVVSAKVDGSQHALFDLAKELVLEGQEALGEKENFLLNANGDCVKGTVSATYDADGTTYSGTNTTAFIKLATGSISSFAPGEYIHIRAASDNDNARCLAKVEDVIYDEYFNQLNIGPGIVVTLKTSGPNGGTVTEADSNLDNVAAGDEIVASGEKAYNFPAAFGALCNDAAWGTYFGVDRTAVSNAYLQPIVRHWDSLGTGLGTATALDVDAHMGAFVKSFARMLSGSRNYRRNHGFALTDAIVCQAHPDLCVEFARQCGDSSARFTLKMASDLSEAARQNLVAVKGWDGAVLRTPLTTIPKIALQEEPLMSPGTFRIFEPSCMEKIRMGGRAIKWLPNAAGGYWHNRSSTSTGNLTVSVQAFGYVMETFFCDQPRLVTQHDGLKDSLS